MKYVLSDIHGNIRRFHKALDMIGFSAKDTLYIDGDTIDRNPYGIEILREIIPEKNIKMLLGNHEHMMMNAICQDRLPWFRERTKSNLSLWYANGGQVTHEAFQKLSGSQQEEIFEYLKKLPVFMDVKAGGVKFRIAHAAPPDLYRKEDRWDFEDVTAFCVWKRHLDFSMLPDDYTLIFGHTPTIYFKSQRVLEIWRSENGRAIDIDCGCMFEGETGAIYPVRGRLALLRLDDMEVFYAD